MKQILALVLLFLTAAPQSFAVNFNLNRELGNRNTCTVYLYQKGYVVDLQESWTMCGWADVRTLKCGIELLNQGYADELYGALNMCKRNENHNSFACAADLVKGKWERQFDLAQRMCEWATTAQITCAKKRVSKKQSPELYAGLLACPR